LKAASGLPDARHYKNLAVGDFVCESEIENSSCIKSLLKREIHVTKLGTASCWGH
jgi:hypothetical protein